MGHAPRPAWRAAVGLALLTSSACGSDGSGTSLDAAIVGDSDSAPDLGSTDDAHDGEGGDAVDPDVAPTQTPIRVWCSESTRLLCEWMYRCFDDDDRAAAERAFAMTEDTCAPQFDASCQSRTMASVSAGRQSYDGQVATTCLAAIEQSECDTLANMAEAINPAVCDGVTIGLVDRGGACTNTPDCSAPNARCIDGACTGSLGRAAFRDACASDAECPGLYCAPMPENGAAITGICSARCGSVSDCGPDAQCVQDAEENRFCLAECGSSADCGDALECQPLAGGTACFVPPP